MNTISLQKNITKLEKAIKSAKRVLLEFEVAQSRWEIVHGYGKAYASAGQFMRHMKRKL